MTRHLIAEFVLLVAAILIVAGTGMLVRAETAPRGLARLVSGVALAVIGTLLYIQLDGYRWLAGALAIGAVIGAALSSGDAERWTAPVVRALAGGGLAAALAAASIYHRAMISSAFISRSAMAGVGFAILLGSMAAAAALTVAFTRRNAPVAARGWLYFTAPAGAFTLGLLAFLVIYPAEPRVLYAMTLLAAAVGMLVPLSVDARDPSVLVARIETLAGLAVCALGFAGGSAILVVVGALAGGASLALARGTPSVN